MAPSISQRLADVHPRNLAMRGESLRRIPANDDERRQIGLEIDAALKLFPEIPRKVASERMGYADESQLNRWISGTDTANFAKLRLIGPEFRVRLLIVQAKTIGLGVRTRTLIEIEEQIPA